MMSTPPINSPLAERVRAHFRGLGMQSMEVPEWGADPKVLTFGVDAGPAKIYWRPTTLFERGSAVEAGKKPLAFYAALVCAKALDENGQRLFTDHDRHVLQNEAAGEIVMRIGEAMLAVSEPKPLGE